MKNYLKAFSKWFRKKDPRPKFTSEESQLQDQLQEPKTRGPERKAFDNKTFEQARKGNGANPNREIEPGI